jgi:hypothetical protein
VEEIPAFGSTLTVSCNPKKRVITKMKIDNEIKSRDFSSISPSARDLLFLKGYTNIPYARQTAELLSHPEKFVVDYDNKDFMFWARILHFESRYWSLDELLSDLEIKNILELSSGFSFRSLEISKQKGFHYIDTDLTSVIQEKKKLLAALTNNTFSNDLELLPLNALDEERFQDVIKHFTKGKIVIINEGLLIYLNQNEKEKLCNIIHKILVKNGGYWITADIYIKNQIENTDIEMDKNTSDFRALHKTEENKFNSFLEAEKFFDSMHFTIEKEANVNLAKLNSLHHMFNGNFEENSIAYQQFPTTQKTWRLKVKN